MTMVDKMNSISHNHIWELIELLVGNRPKTTKWIYKVKKNSMNKG
jgi:hypothetical protein